MKRLLRRAAGSSLFLAALASAHGCRVDESALDDKLWFCDPLAAGDTCGTEHGKPMTCYSAVGLGGGGFCTSTCDPAVPVADPEHWFCTASGALLEVCNPSTPSVSCPAGLSCYRTELSLIGDEGLCVPAPVCSTDADCAGSGARTECVETFVSAAYPTPALSTDHLQCVQPCGDADSSPCAPEEQCAADLYWVPNTPSVCVPRCSEDDPCPPNFFCLAEAGPAYPSICTPGLPGYRCSHEEDCAVGDCRDTGAGFSVCSIDCDPAPDPTRDLCSLLDSSRGPAVCQGSMCVIVSPFTGAFCATDTDCRSGEVCSAFDPFNPTVPRTPLGYECHRTCDGPGDCPAQGVMPFVCLEYGASRPAEPGSYGECYPADFGLRCEEGVDVCFGQLTCMPPASGGNAICTIPCDDDATCAGNHLTKPGLCKDGICQRRVAGDPCDASSLECPSKCGDDGRCE